jgi:hypothetical protein
VFDVRSPTWITRYITLATNRTHPCSTRVFSIESDIISTPMKLYFISLLAMIVVYFLHQIGMDGGYMHIWWLDIVTHALVCFSIALCVGGLINSFVPNLKHKKLLIIGLTFAVGFAWEWLEVFYNITGHPLWSQEYYLDTVKDFLDDTIGAAVAAYISTRK